MQDSPQLAPANHPNLYLSIIRLTTVITMPYKGNDNKDQLRSFKSRLHSTFRPRRNTLAEQDMSITPSPTDSECSTLIDFANEDVEAKGISGMNSEEEATRAVMLEEENCSWVDERAYNAPLRTSQSSRSTTRHVYSGASDMIDEDDRAWCMPSKQAKIKSSPLFSLASRRQKATGRSGLEPEMLDPEDRAWM